MWLFKLLLLVGAAYVGVLVLLYVQQTRMLFPTQLAAASGGLLPASASALEVATADGERLRGVHIPPQQGAAGGRLTIVGFGGNAWNAESVAAFLHALYPAADVVAFHYRGYPPSSGRPSTAALLADAPIIFDHVVEALGLAPVVAVGFSIGAGVAAHLATIRPVDGLILVTPFDSLAALAREHFPWAPVGLFMRHRMVPEDSVRRQATPTAVIAAGNDAIVPARRTDALRQAIKALVFDRTIADADHNDLYERGEFQAAMREALARIRLTGDAQAAFPP